MGKINYGRVILGGLLAGLVINVLMAITWGWLLAEQHAQVMERLGLAEPAGAQIVWFWVFGFALGIVVLWTYAAIRPRFGAGPRTAALAGILAWLLSWVVPDLYMMVMGMFTFDFVVVGWLVGLITFVLAGLIGGSLYQEGGAAPAAQPSPGP